MSSSLKVEDLEKSLMQRADDLAKEYLQRAQRSHDHFISDENERLHLREEKEVMAAKMQAESLYRSQVQSSELKVQKKLDQLRWKLIKQVIEQVKEQSLQLSKDKEKYRQLLIDFIRHSVDLIDDNNLIIELNKQDYQFFIPQWSKILEQVDSTKNITYSKQFHHMSGGIMIYDQSRSIRIDNTFEGRLERLADNIHQLVAEHFFSELSHESEKIHGR